MKLVCPLSALLSTHICSRKCKTPSCCTALVESISTPPSHLLLWLLRCSSCPRSPCPPPQVGTASSSSSSSSSSLFYLYSLFCPRLWVALISGLLGFLLLATQSPCTRVFPPYPFCSVCRIYGKGLLRTSLSLSLLGKMFPHFGLTKSLLPGIFCVCRFETFHLNLKAKKVLAGRGNCKAVQRKGDVVDVAWLSPLPLLRKALALLD
eukprot:RCo028338